MTLRFLFVVFVPQILILAALVGGLATGKTVGADHDDW